MSMAAAAAEITASNTSCVVRALARPQGELVAGSRLRLKINASSTSPVKGNLWAQFVGVICFSTAISSQRNAEATSSHDRVQERLMAFLQELIPQTSAMEGTTSPNAATSSDVDEGESEGGDTFFQASNRRDRTVSFWRDTSFLREVGLLASVRDQMSEEAAFALKRSTNENGRPFLSSKARSSSWPSLALEEGSTPNSSEFRPQRTSRRMSSVALDVGTATLSKLPPSADTPFGSRKWRRVGMTPKLPAGISPSPKTGGVTLDTPQPFIYTERIPIAEDVDLHGTFMTGLAFDVPRDLPSHFEGENVVIRYYVSLHFDFACRTATPENLRTNVLYSLGVKSPEGWSAELPMTLSWPVTIPLVSLPKKLRHRGEVEERLPWRVWCLRPPVTQLPLDQRHPAGDPRILSRRLDLPLFDFRVAVYENAGLPATTSSGGLLMEASQLLAGRTDFSSALLPASAVSDACEVLHRIEAAETTEENSSIRVAGPNEEGDIPAADAVARAASQESALRHGQHEIQQYERYRIADANALVTVLAVASPSRIRLADVLHVTGAASLDDGRGQRPWIIPLGDALDLHFDFGSATTATVEIHSFIEQTETVLPLAQGKAQLPGATTRVVHVWWPSLVTLHHRVAAWRLHVPHNLPPSIQSDAVTVEYDLVLVFEVVLQTPASSYERRKPAVMSPLPPPLSKVSSSTHEVVAGWQLPLAEKKCMSLTWKLPMVLIPESATARERELETHTSANDVWVFDSPADPGDL